MSLSVMEEYNTSGPETSAIAAVQDSASSAATKSNTNFFITKTSL